MMGSPSLEEIPSLARPVPLPGWQRLQDRFARVLGIPLRTIRPTHELLTTPSWPPGLDPEQAIRLLKIGEELDQLVTPAQPPTGTMSLVTPLGVTYAAASLPLAPKPPVAYVVAGPVIVGPREEEASFRQRMESAGQPAYTLWPLLLSLKCFTFVGMQAALDLMADVGTALVEREGANGGLPAPPVGGAQAGLRDPILRALLEAAALALQADGGSVMLVDPDGQTLRIRAAQGLPADIVSGARVKSGEGLAGLALAERRALVVDERAEDRIRQRMARPQLTSSLVVPLGPLGAEEPIGVLSLWTRDAARRFAASDIDLLAKVPGTFPLRISTTLWKT